MRLKPMTILSRWYREEMNNLLKKECHQHQRIISVIEEMILTTVLFVLQFEVICIHLLERTKWNWMIENTRSRTRCLTDIGRDGVSDLYWRNLFDLIISNVYSLTRTSCPSFRGRVFSLSSKCDRYLMIKYTIKTNRATPAILPIAIPAIAPFDKDLDGINVLLAGNVLIEVLSSCIVVDICQ